MESGYNGCMEWFEFMSAADGRKRELANFEIDAKPKKKGSASSPACSAGKAAAGVKKGAAAAKPASNA